MKTIGLLCLILSLVIPAYAMEMASEKEEEKPKPTSICPVTKYSESCSSCHILKRDASGKPYFGIKEVKIDANYDEKPYQLKIIQEKAGGPPVGYILVENISASVFQETAQYLAWHPEIKKLLVEIHSPGGGVLSAWKAIGHLEIMRARGIEIVTICNGFAASAGALMFVSGDIRRASPHAELLFHKVWTFSMFKIESVDDAQDEAEVMKHLQKNLNDYIISRTGIDEKLLSERIYKRDWWLTGKEAFELNIVNELIE